MIVQKKHGKTVRAYELGAGTEAEQRMMAEGKLLAHPDGSYELFSQETDEHGERAKAGDFFKIDSSDQPYPNARAYFLSNHRPLDEPDTYEQIPKPLRAWCIEEPVCEEISWLQAQGRLCIHEQDAAHYFSAKLWGTLERTPKDSIIVFYSTDHNEHGEITDVDFNFVARDEFEKTYDVVER